MLSRGSSAEQGLSRSAGGGVGVAAGVPVGRQFLRLARGASWQRQRAAPDATLWLIIGLNWHAGGGSGLPSLIHSISERSSGLSHENTASHLP